VEAEPGPGLKRKALVLHLVLPDGSSRVVMRATGRQTGHVPLRLHAGVNMFDLRCDGGGEKIRQIRGHLTFAYLPSTGLPTGPYDEFRTSRYRCNPRV